MENIRRLFKWSPTFLAILAEGANVAMNMQVSAPLLTVLVTILFLVQILILQQEIQNLKNTQPHIVVDPKVGEEDLPTTDWKFVWNTPGGNTSGTVVPSTSSFIAEAGPQVEYRTEGKRYLRYYVSFRNVPKKGVLLRDAKDIHAKVTFEGEKTVSHEKPRWLNDPDSVTIKANGKPEGLYLVIRASDHKELYVFNGDSYTQYGFHPMNPDLLLKEGRYSIHIQLTDNLGWSGEYSVQLTVGEAIPFFELKQ